VWNKVACDIEVFLSLRPYAYHLTSVDNLPSIRAAGGLESAATLSDRGGARRGLLRQPRSKHVRLPMSRGAVWLRDQRRLKEGQMSLEGGWQFGDFVERLNSLVFFWPGKQDGPLRAGQQHFKYYQGEHPEILRVGTEVLLRDNPGLTPLFCRYNSGFPRCNPRTGKSPRGPDTFVPSNQFTGSCSDVVELTFPGGVRLPNCTERASTPQGPWRRLFESPER
jgi:hypothetical protein